ncbi:MAG: chorismate-binding protein [Acidobacteriota bacterium]|nr:chorismate-binding protein [Acidobacteriota bacterium]MDE3264766.1 chorismate-binding protein [Acidobacteriota bacterium]
MSRPASAIAHTREFLADTSTPLGVYRKLAAHEDGDGSARRFLLESVTGGEHVSRYSFLGASPSQVCRVHLDRIEVEDLRNGGGVRVEAGEPLPRLRRLLDGVAADPAPPLPFAGGWIGAFGFDAIRLAEPCLVDHAAGRPPDPFGLPVAILARYDDILVFDHARQRIVAVANEIEGENTAADAEARLDGLQAVLESRGEAIAARVEDRGIKAETADPTLSDEEHGRAVNAAKEYIAAGDIFQVVLARRWALDLDVPPPTVYRALRLVNPSPYMVLFESPEVSLIGASPEMLVRRTGRRLEVRPIAGTRPRGRTPAEDRALAEELMADPKERAEHVMLVDLGRNDLGRVAKPGGVSVEEFMVIEHYSDVMHIVSSVEAEQSDGAGSGAGSALDALLACFPAGTLSGAPKIRAVEIIDELEPEARGMYGGSVGYFSFGGDMDACITIRTLAIVNGEASITAGGGIVADSDPVREAQETRDKAAALLRAVALARELEGRA